MLKKTLIVSSIIVIVCLVAAAVLFPIAVGDSVAMAREAGSAYSYPVELYSQPGQSIASVSLSNGWAHRMEVRPSADGTIRIYTDGYNTNPPVVTGAASDAGELQLFFSRTSYSGIGFIGLSREVMQRSFMALFNDRSTDNYVLELPAEVTFNTLREGNRRYNNLVVHPGVKLIEPAPYPLAPDDASLPQSPQTWVSSGDWLAFESEFDLLFERVERGELGSFISIPPEGSLDWDDGVFWEMAEPMVTRLTDSLDPGSEHWGEIHSYIRTLTELKLCDALEEHADRLYEARTLTRNSYDYIEIELRGRVLDLSSNVLTLRQSLPAGVVAVIEQVLD